jgi:hypothetical protein
MKQLKLIERDLGLTNNKFTLVDNDDSLMQQITNQVTMWLGEWFANTSIGIDYIGFENKKFSDKEIASSVTQSLYKNPNVSLVNSVLVSRNLAERKITLDVNIETVEGNMVLTI